MERPLFLEPQGTFLGKRDNRAVKVGYCGFAGPQRQYFRLFRVIEIQQSFYQLPQINTAEKWCGAAPSGFEFTLKARQLITHEPTSTT